METDVSQAALSAPLPDLLPGTPCDVLRRACDAQDAGAALGGFAEDFDSDAAGRVGAEVSVEAADFDAADGVVGRRSARREHDRSPGGELVAFAGRSGAGDQNAGAIGERQALDPSALSCGFEQQGEGLGAVGRALLAAFAASGVHVANCSGPADGRPSSAARVSSSRSPWPRDPG